MSLAAIKAHLEREIHAHAACRHVRVQIIMHRATSKATAPWSAQVRILGTSGPVDPDACAHAIHTIIARAYGTWPAKPVTY